MGRATRCYDEDLERSRVDICAWGIWGELVDSGAGVGYSGVLWGKEGGWGGATGRGRRTIFSIKCVI